MNQLFGIGKQLLGGDKKGEGSSSGGSGGASGLSSNPMKLLKQFDRDGDGNITENGKWITPFSPLKFQDIIMNFCFKISLWL